VRLEQLGAQRLVPRQQRLCRRPQPRAQAVKAPLTARRGARQAARA
jgi:hypothetical protein